jgi:hypothetical protein
MKGRGSIILSGMFVLLTSLIGLYVLNSYILHNRIRGARIKKLRETGHMQQELIHYLHEVKKKIFEEKIDQIYQPEIEYFNNIYFPEVIRKNTILKNSFSYISFDKGNYSRIQITDFIRVTSPQNKYCIASEILIDLLSGKIPLHLFPLFINKSISAPLDTYKKENKILDSQNNTIVVDDIGIEINGSQFLLDLLGMAGYDLTWENIREKFGFEISQQPLQKGLYMKEENGIISCLFIQGDVEDLVFSSHENIQIIGITIDGNITEILYKPGQRYFMNKSDSTEMDVLFKERIVINGNIRSLRQGETPAFTNQTNLILFCSGEIIIKSNLETKKNTINHKKTTHLTLINIIHMIFQNVGLKPGVTVDTKEKTSLEATIITQGIFKNKGSELIFKGSLYCTDFINNHKMRLFHLLSNFDFPHFFQTTNYKYISNFLINFIQEISNDTE